MNKSNTAHEERDEWRTPHYLFRYANNIVGGFQYDAACNRRNALADPVHPRFKDALSVPWKGRVWCNPPYSNIEPWVDAAFKCQGTVCMLIPTPNGEARYERLMNEAYEISIVGRIGFINAAGKEIKGSPRGSSLFIIGDYGLKGQRICMNRETIRNWRIHA